MRSSVPDGDLARVIEAAVTEKLERLEARRFGYGGRPTVENLSLLCRTHNAFLAEIDYGRGAVTRAPRPSRVATATEANAPD